MISRRPRSNEFFSNLQLLSSRNSTLFLYFIRNLCARRWRLPCEEVKKKLDSRFAICGLPSSNLSAKTTNRRKSRASVAVDADCAAAALLALWISEASRAAVTTTTTAKWAALKAFISVHEQREPSPPNSPLPSLCVLTWFFFGPRKSGIRKTKKMPQQQRQKQKQLQTEQQAQEQQQQLTIFKIAHNGMGVGRIRVRGKEHRTIRGGY